ncbi:MAG: low molecular weight protein-tyrosine-phosphatase [Longimicrobiales bacterium]
MNDERASQSAAPATPERRIGVLFVCLGNICRSPLAEGVFRELIRRARLAERFHIASAGTSDYHTGESPDRRTAEVAQRRGIVLDHAAAQIRPQDLDRFDYVLAMDRQNLSRIQRLAGGRPHRARVALLRTFEDDVGAGELEVPDPYFGGPRGFEDVHDMVERACTGLLEHIRRSELAVERVDVEDS